LAGNAGDDQLMTQREPVGLGMAEEQTAEHFAGRCDDGYREIADDRKMAFGRPFIGGVVAIARVLSDITRADDALAAESRREHCGITRLREALEILP
jgi:hypothetical protein